MSKEVLSHYNEGRKDAARAILDGSHKDMWEDYCPYKKDTERYTEWKRGWYEQWREEDHYDTPERR